MIDRLVRKFERLDKDIEVLSNVLVFFIMLLFARVALLIYEHRFDKLWTIFAPMTALVAALLVARVATRLIANNEIIREDDRRRDLVRVTHHLLAVAQDLLARVGYVKVLLSTGNRPVFALGEIVTTIERRYETLLERDSYQYLPGQSVDLIIRISGSIFGICTLARGLEKVTTDKPLASIDSVLLSDREQQVAKLGDLMDDLNKFIDQIYEVRGSIN